MEVKVAGQSDNLLKLEIEEGNHEVLNALVNKLLGDSDVTFAAYKREHPLFNKYSLVLRTGKKNAKTVFNTAVKDLSADINTFKKELLAKIK